MKPVAALLFPLLLTVSFALTSSEATTPPPSSPSLYKILAAEIALDREHPETALENYIAAARETQDPQIASRATQIALAVSSLENALEPAIIWATSAPNDLEAQMTAAALYLRLDRIADAIPYLTKTETLQPEEAFQYYMILYRQFQEEKDSERILKALEQLTQNEKNAVGAPLALAEIYLSQNKNEAALQLCERVLAHAPHSPTGIQLYTETLLRTRSKEAAKSYLDRTMKTESTSPLLAQYYAQFLYDHQYPKEARAEIEKIIRDNTLTPEEYLQFARLSMQAQWFDLAKKILLKTRTVDDDRDLSHYFLARTAEMQHNNQEAIEWFKQVLTGPFHVLSQVRASVLLTEEKKYNEALQLLAQAQPSDAAESKQILLTTIDVLNQAQRYSDSLATLELALINNPDDLDLRYARSLIADTLNNIPLAESDLRAILAIEPNHLDALNALGYILTNRTHRYPEAEQYLRQALKLSPNNPSVLDSMGWLYYKTGRYRESVELLQKAHDIQPDAEVAAHLGEVLWQMKDFEGAKRVWNQALQQHPKHENIINTMQRFIPTKKEK